LIEFGFDTTHLQKLSLHFDLQNNDDIKKFNKIVQAQKDSEERTAYDKAMPSQEVIGKILEEAGELGKA